MQTATASSTESARLADQLERAFHGGSWHGPSVLQALRGVDAVKASRRPVGAAHSIWEITAHVGTWMEVARLRILGHDASALTGEDGWTTIEHPSEEAWSEAVAVLEQTQRELQTVVRDLADERLDDPVPGSDPTVRGLLLGVLQHNVYHAGQISLLKKVEGSAESSS